VGGGRIILLLTDGFKEREEGRKSGREGERGEFLPLLSPRYHVHKKISRNRKGGGGKKKKGVWELRRTSLDVVCTRAEDIKKGGGGKGAGSSPPL